MKTPLARSLVFVAHDARATSISRLEILIMFHYAVVFFLIALVAAVFGFGGVASGAGSIAQVLFLLFVVLAIVSFAFGLIRRA